MNIFFSIINLIISIVALLGIGCFIFFLGKMVFHFFPMIKNIKNSKYYALGPLILMSDSYFTSSGIIHRKKFLESGKKILFVGIGLIIIGVYITGVRYKLNRLCCINQNLPHILEHGEEKETAIQSKKLVGLQPGFDQSWFTQD